jgi:siroheme decarboxylase
MRDIVMESVDKTLLGLLQMKFPLTREPFADLGLILGVSQETVIEHINSLKSKGIIRQISPVMDARKMGFQSTLVAMKIAPKYLEKAEEVISAHPGISHGYQRENDFNVWVTLSVPPSSDLNEELEILRATSGAEAIFSLPALKVFKLRAFFGSEGEEEVESANTNGTGALPQKAKLSLRDRLIINEIQEDLPLTGEPFAKIAAKLNLEIGDFLAQCQSLLDRGIIRRYGAAINHRNAGYKANAMSCWIVPSEKVDEMGRNLAELREVSHCYERKTNGIWPYNIFAMVHGCSRGDCRRIVDRVSEKTGLTESKILFSNREFKKIRIKYRV